MERLGEPLKLRLRLMPSTERAINALAMEESRRSRNEMIRVLLERATGTSPPKGKKP